MTAHRAKSPVGERDTFPLRGTDFVGEDRPTLLAAAGSAAVALTGEESRLEGRLTGSLPFPIDAKAPLVRQPEAPGPGVR